MGKRKERKLAAMMATSRRVKLDLCAEPPGEFNDLSAHAEGGGDIESKSHTGLPNSPSSSDPEPENPLLLLGQYSDDEVNDETSKGLHSSVVENSSVDLDDQVRVPSHKECEATAITTIEDLAAQKDDQNKIYDSSVSLDVSQELNANGTREINITDLSHSTDLCIGVDSSEQISVPVTSDTQVAGDVSSGWKMVLHEESNQYYYWNVVTGETSWQVPAVLAQGTEVNGKQEASANIEVGLNPVDMHIFSSTSEVEVDGSITKQPCYDTENVTPNCGAKETCRLTPEMESQNEEYKGDSDIVSEKTGGHDLNQVGVVSSLHHGLPSDFVHSRLSSGAVLDGQCAFSAVSEKCAHDTKDHEECVSTSELSSHLVKYGEYLLERLTSLRGSESHLKGREEWISKFILEVEIRLSDIQSLSLHGSSLLPFWKHSVMQLKKVEAAFQDEIGVAYKPLESISNIVKAVADNKKAYSDSEIPQASNRISPLTCTRGGSTSDASKSDTEGNNSFSSGYLSAQSFHDAVGKLDVVGITVSAELPSKNVHHPGEDIDMDVDMEVEEPIPVSNTTEEASDIQYHAPPQQSIVPNLPEEKSIGNAEDFGIPPLPNEEWIPPPPLDDEPFPPPPPDEPPEPLYPLPLSDLEVAQPFSYAQQYNLSYPIPNTEYYMPTSIEISGNSFYTHGVVPHPPLYYEAVPSTYSSAIPAVIHSVDTAAYYGLQDGTAPPLPVVDGIDSSRFLYDSGHGSTGSDQFALAEPLLEAGCTPLPNTNADIYGGRQTKTEGSSVEAPFLPRSLQSASTISVSANVSSSSSVSSTTTVVAAAATATKVQAKVSRSKKRTVSVVSTLRSNKKVSSLVDKWKAAKEELHEDEDDAPENAYEVLEKKRQREIEEWRAQQIASGEAKENANFQPLCGDWRERVKRKRALVATEVERSSLESACYGNQRPDLSELSRDLPSGWQAYWDESSKQVYYGNAATSETTWIKPTN